MTGPAIVCDLCDAPAADASIGVPLCQPCMELVTRTMVEDGAWSGVRSLALDPARS
jgi:hypothetical protein